MRITRRKRSSGFIVEYIFSSVAFPLLRFVLCLLFVDGLSIFPYCRQDFAFCILLGPANIKTLGVLFGVLFLS